MSREALFFTIAVVDVVETLNAKILKFHNLFFYFILNLWTNEMKISQCDQNYYY